MDLGGFTERHDERGKGVVLGKGVVCETLVSLGNATSMKTCSSTNEAQHQHFYSLRQRRL
jgi:hypothetical protein